VSKEWLKYLMCMSDYSFPPMLYGMLKRVADRVSEEDFREMVAANQRIRAVFKVSTHPKVTAPTFEKKNPTKHSKVSKISHKKIFYICLDLLIYFDS
jgi:hypothetical protein